MQKSSEPSASKEGHGKVISSRHGYYQLKLILCCNFTYLRQEAICAGGFLVIPVTKTTNGLILTWLRLLFFFHFMYQQTTRRLPLRFIHIVP